MIKEVMCSNKLCESLANIGMPIGVKKGWFGRTSYECSLAQAMKWFREKKGIHIMIEWHTDNMWTFALVSDYLTDEEWDYSYYTYEDAVAAALYMAIIKVEDTPALQ